MTTRVIYMSYLVGCSITGCPFGNRSVESLDELFDLEEQHMGDYGDHHRLEFEREGD